MEDRATVFKEIAGHGVATGWRKDLGVVLNPGAQAVILEDGEHQTLAVRDHNPPGTVVVREVLPGSSVAGRPAQEVRISVGVAGSLRRILGAVLEIRARAVGLRQRRTPDAGREDHLTQGIDVARKNGAVVPVHEPFVGREEDGMESRSRVRRNTDGTLHDPALEIHRTRGGSGESGRGGRGIRCRSGDGRRSATGGDVDVGDRIRAPRVRRARDARAAVRERVPVRLASPHPVHPCRRLISRATSAESRWLRRSQPS